MRRLPTLFLACFLILFAAADVHAQVSLSIDSLDISAFPDVRMKVRVMDGSSNISGLSVTNFSVFEDGNVQPITAGYCEDTLSQEPLAVLLLIDISRSMAPWPLGNGGLSAAKTAAMQFVDRLTDDDSIAVVSFSEQVYYNQPWTNDRARVKQKIDDLDWVGPTALWDGVNTSANLIRYREQKRIMIVLADGDDNSSRVTDSEAIANATSAGCTIYSIGLGSEVDEVNMRLLADRTGGKYYYAPSPGDLDQIYSEIAEELQSTGICEINYRSPIDCWNGDLVNIDVEVQAPTGFAFAQTSYTLPYDTSTFSYVRVSMQREYVVEADEEITIPVELTRVSTMRSPDVFEFSVEFDTDLLQLVDVAAGSLAADYNILHTPTLQGAVVQLNGGNAISTEGELCNLTFRAAPVYESRKTEVQITPPEVQQFCTVASSDFGLITVSGLCERAIHQSAGDSARNAQVVTAPNPFIGSTTVRFQLEHDAHVIVRVHDLLGRPVATLVDDMRSAGMHVVRFDAVDLPAGKYVVRFEGDGISEVVQVHLMK